MSMDRMTKRDRQGCYNCRFFAYTERKNSTTFRCERIRNALVGAGWCKYYKPIKEDQP